MSPNRPEREGDAGQPGAPDRPAMSRRTPVTDMAQVQSQLDQLLAHCRRRRVGLALLRVSIESVSLPGASVSTSMEQRVRQEVANRIGNAVRGSDAILRESDCDTCVVLPGADGAVAGRVARRLERLVNGDYCIAGKVLQVAVRIGAAVHPDDGARPLELLHKADPRD